MKNKTKKLTFLGLCASVALILSYVESLLPPLLTVAPGIKMGLPNIIIIFILYKFGTKEAAAVSVIRLAAVALLFGNVMTLLYSTVGAVLSLALMSAFKKLNFFSRIGVSVIGGVAHNLGQVAVAIAVMQTAEIGYYMLILTVSGTLAGIFVGFCGNAMLSALKSIKL